MEMGASASPFLSLRGIRKRFGSVEALRGIDLVVYRNEIVSVVGDNGAGKSTLMKILTGVYRPDEGIIEFDGRPVRFNSPEDSRQVGIEMVYQDMALARYQDAGVNIFLGREPMKRLGPLRVLDYPSMWNRAAELLQELAIELNVRQPTGRLSGGQQQAVAIARILSAKVPPKLVILDEPTAALAIQEVEKVLHLIRMLKQRGTTVILISHRLSDVFAVSDRIIVLRSGVVVGELSAREATTEGVVRLMVGAH